MESKKYTLPSVRELLIFKKILRKYPTEKWLPYQFNLNMRVKGLLWGPIKYICPKNKSV